MQLPVVNQRNRLGIAADVNQQQFAQRIGDAGKTLIILSLLGDKVHHLERALGDGTRLIGKEDVEATGCLRTVDFSDQDVVFEQLFHI